MYTETQLDCSKDYVWILSNIEERAIKGKPTVLFTWTCKDADVIIKEYLRICNPLPDCRLGKLMQCLGWDAEKEPNQTPSGFFGKGLHIKAKPLKHWSELNSEDLVWKLNYDELVPMEEKMQTINNEDMLTLQRIGSGNRTYKDALAHVATRRPELIKAFIKLSEDGILKFAT